MGELSAPVVVLRVTVRAPDLDAFITRYSRHIAGDRIFIFSKAPQPVGTHVRFNLQLTSGEVLLQGRGTVKRVQEDRGDARHPPGMEVQFKPLDERSSTLVDFMMATRAGLTEKVASSAKMAPVARAVVPPKPKPLAPLPLPLPPLPTPSKPIALPPPTPSRPIALRSPAPAAPTPPATPPPKPAPMARPPSLSLESVWKTEASDAGAEPVTMVEAPPAPEPPTPPPPADSPITVLPPVEPVAVAAPPEPPAAEPPAAEPPALEAQPATPSKSHDLPTIIPPLVDPAMTATPVFAESWGGDAPANPFGDVSDGAIEYFVEWSIEQSIGPRARPQAKYSDVPMALPGDSDAPSRRRQLAQFGALFAAGALVGGLVVGLATRHPSSAPIVVEPQATAAPSPKAAPPEPPAEPKAAAGDAELVVTSRPSGASVTIDGASAGATPLATHVAAGRHEIAVAKERYATATTNSDAPGKLALDLRRPPATLHVTSNPPAADVTIAGEHRGKTPVDVRLPGFESYDVRVALTGARPWRKTVYLAHAANRVDAALVVSKQPVVGAKPAPARR